MGKAYATVNGRKSMQWVYVYLTLAKNIPVLSAGKDNYETEQECQLAHAGRDENPFWCVPSNWLDEGQRRAVRALPRLKFIDFPINCAPIIDAPSISGGGLGL